MGRLPCTGGPRRGQPQWDRPRAGCRRVDLRDLGFGPGEADAEPFDLAEPAFALGLGNSIEQVVADLREPTTLRGVRAQEGAADAGVFVDAGGAVGAGAGADGQLAAFEVAEEVLPLGVSRV